MQKVEIKRFFECLIPVTVCNLKCSYCYVIQRDYRNMKMADMKYSPEKIGKALTQERLGGPCFFSICGAGETLAQPETLPIIYELLSQGHIINITSNGTLTNKFHKLANYPAEYLERLHFSFSLHYVELKKRNLLKQFFENVNFVKELGCSILVQLNLCDEYIPYIEEIKTICKEKVGAYPQVAATRKEKTGLAGVELMTDLSTEEYKKIGDTFDSNLFAYTMKNFNVKRTEFCYAGERSGILDLSTGILRKCYAAPTYQNIFENPECPIDFTPIGTNCCSSFCFNSTHFMSQGVIDNDDSCTYCSLRDRPNARWFNSTTKFALSRKLKDTNVQYSALEQNKISRKVKVQFTIQHIKNIGPRVIRKLKKAF